MPGVGDLVQTRSGKWMTLAPTYCSNGHQLVGGRVLVGHVACMGHGGGGHTLWHCRECDDTVYGPPLAEHCTVLAGPAAVRISSQSGVEAHRQTVPDDPPPPPF